MGSPLGSGGLGLVYATVHAETGRAEAMKVPRADRYGDPQVRARFEEEMRIGLYVHHPHLCAAYGVDSAPDGRPCLHMERVDGPTLDGVLAASGPLPPVTAVRWARQIALAVHALHRAQVVHRDLKLANIARRADGSICVLDLGVARTPAFAVPLTRPGHVVGTPGYMAPEQANAAAVDARADQFAIGVCLYEMLTGQNPFGGAAEAAAVILYRNAMDRPAPLEGDDWPVARGRILSALVQRMMAPAPSDRFGDLDEVVEALDRWLGAQPSSLPRIASAAAFAAASVASAVLGAGLMRFFAS